ncbi:MAG: hypothetical protein ACREIE_07040 [Nitrospiraceae bacterium]
MPDPNSSSQGQIGSATMVMLLAGLTALGATAVWADEMPMTDQAALQVIEAFCRAEFDEDSDKRFELIKFTSGGRAAELHRAGHGMIPGVRIFPEQMPLIVVTSYVVETVTVSQDRARATVIYRTVARKGEGGIFARIVPSTVQPERVELQLVYADGRWWIFDPPLPRISLETMILVYRQELAQYEAKSQKDPEHRERVKKPYRIAQENLRLLESLRAKVK